MAAAKLKICKPQMRRIWEALLFIFAKRSNAPENSLAADAFKELIVCRLKAMYNSNSDKDIGTKRIISIGENDFIMTKARVLVGEAPQMENPAEGQADITEALGELFQECFKIYRSSMRSVRVANRWLIPPRVPFKVRQIRTFIANPSVVRVRDCAGESRSSLMRTRTPDSLPRVECSSTRMLQQ